MKKIHTGNQPVSGNIARVIQEKGYKQSAIAKRAGYSRQAFCNMVNDYKIIRPDDVMRIADALEVKPGELFLQ